MLAIIFKLKKKNEIKNYEKPNYLKQISKKKIFFLTNFVKNKE